MKVIVLGSGSKGNSTLLIENNTKILIDVGFSYPKMKMLLEKYDYDPSMIDAILITHTHKDHVAGLSSFVKKNNVKVFVNEVLFRELSKTIDEENLLLVDNEFNIENLCITTIKTSHDSDGSVGFIVENENKSLVYITDTGYINQRNLKKIVNKNLYIFESNHDVSMLMNGPYPYILKQRVLSDKGHLSNELAGTYLRDVIGINTQKIVLAHLSETNNCAEIAINTNKEIIGDKLSGIELLVALQDEILDLGEI